MILFFAASIRTAPRFARSRRYARRQLNQISGDGTCVRARTARRGGNRADVFISYKESDADRVRPLVEHLRAVGDRAFASITGK